MKWYKLVARVSQSSFRFLKNLTNLLDALFSGFWLGVMGKKSLDFTDELYYNKSKSYSNDKYNESGLFKWEKSMIEKHFSGFETILLIAAGGGREALALSKMGFKVDSYECNPSLVEYGNSLLKKNNSDARIEILKRNLVPEEVIKYDGIIIGWGAYSHMEGTAVRQNFLNSLKPFMNNDSRLMISFLYVTNRNKKDKIVVGVSNFFREFSGQARSEPGDRLEPDFIHYFMEDEIRDELTSAGFTVTDYSTDEYGCLIAEL